MKLTMTLSALLLLGGAGAAQADEIDCYNCRTKECPELKAPQCGSEHPQKKPDGKPSPGEARPVSPSSKVSSPPPAQPTAAPTPPSGSPVGQPAPSVPTVALAARPQSLAEHAPHRLRGAAIGAGVAGLVLAGTGAGFLTIDGNYATCASPGVNSSCQHIWSTVPLGGALVGVGGAALVGAAVLLVLDTRHPRVALSPAPRAGGLASW